MQHSIRSCFVTTACIISAIAACKSQAPKKTDTEIAPTFASDRVPRASFNQLAAELGYPFFWTVDRNSDQTLDPEELDTLWGLAHNAPAYVEDGAFTNSFEQAYEAVVAGHRDSASPADPRQALLRQEARQGQLTVLASDFSKGSAEERAIVGHIQRAAVHIEELYRLQKGSQKLLAQLAPDDSLGRLAFYLNHGPWCTAPETEAQPICSAIEVRPPRLFGLYPASLQAKKGFCDELARSKDADVLLNPFTVVQSGADNKLVGIAFTDAWPKQMNAVAKELSAAAAAITSEREAGFKKYLTAAAKAFTDNDWFAADEAWARMGTTDTAWYLRIGPDETYFEPCNRKAAFHVSFARINPAATKWREKLEPVKQQMEQAVADFAGAPYKARSVAFQLPDFVDIVLNAGDSRSPRGATGGQSLPNWGPVASDSRGRQVVMTNLTRDPDVAAIRRARAAAMLCTDTFERLSDDSEPDLVSTVLHEAAHNLGPAKEYKVRGKTGAQAFGGPLASTMEELKSQTAALYFTDWLADKKIVTSQFAANAHLSDVVWAIKHIARGYYDADGGAKTYSQLAGIQLAFFLENAAVTWKAEAKASNGQDIGCLSVDETKLSAAIVELMTEVAQIKGRNDVKGARAVVKKYIDGEGPWQKVAEAARQRGKRFPQPTYLYSIRL